MQNSPRLSGYGLVRGLVRLLLWLFYRRIEVVGLEQVPADSPLIVAANHHNSVVDAMLLIAVLPRRLHALANAPLFRHALIGPLLRLLGALPVHRRQEAGDDTTRNAALFEATTAALRGGGAILIFPEGRTQPEPVLQELRTGAARMLLAAEAGAQLPRVTLLPVGLLFEQPGTFREGRALVWIGSPLPTSDCLPPEMPSERAARTLTERLATALRGQIVEADDRHTLRLLALVEELWREQEATAPDALARIGWLQRAVRAYRLLLEREPVRVASLRGQLESLSAELEQAGLPASKALPTRKAGALLRALALRGAWLLVWAPLAVCGIAAHALPYQLTGAMVRRIPHTEEEEATDKIAVGLVFYPLCWALEAWGVFAWGGWRALMLFVVALLPAGFFALAWRERLERMARDARAFARVRRDPALPGRLHDQRRALAAELSALARLVPEVWAG